MNYLGLLKFRLYRKDKGKAYFFPLINFLNNDLVP